jgi:hypothetical protein
MPSGLPSLIAGRQQLGRGDSAGSLSELSDGPEGFVDFRLAPIGFGHDSRDAVSMARDDQRRPARLRPGAGEDGF